MTSPQDSAAPTGVPAQFGLKADRMLAALLSNLPGAVFRFKADPDWTVEFVSEGFLLLTGYPTDHVLGQPGSRYVELIHPEDHPTAFRQIQQALAERRKYQVEYRLRTATGEEKWVWERGAGVYSDTGQLDAIEGLVLDISERKRAEAALREAHELLEQRVQERTAELAIANEQLLREMDERRLSDELYRTLVETSPDAVLLVDLEGRVAFASPRAVEMYGGERAEEILGRNPLEFLAPEDHQRLLVNLTRTINEGITRNIEYTFLKKDGTRFSGETSAAVVRDRDGKPRAQAVIIRDITERKQAEEMLRQINHQFHTICEGMIEGLVITNIETKRFVRVNAPLCRMLGYSEQELLAASIRDIHPPEEVPDDLQRFQAAAEGRVSINENRRVLRKDGSIFYADITGQQIVYEGRPCLLALFRDVTERRHAQELLRRQNERLRRSLLASDHERRIISYEIHDSIAQQLAGASLQFEASEQLREKRKWKAAAEAFQEGVQILRACQQDARRLIRGVRPLALDQSSVVVAIEQLVQSFDGKPGPKVEFHHQVEFDRLQPQAENCIYRIVQEAITNARRHSQSENVRVDLQQRDGQISIRIQDWGVGFETQEIDRYAFGLESICERAKMLDGRAEIDTAPGRGTRITVELPLLLRQDDD